MKDITNIDVWIATYLNERGKHFFIVRAFMDQFIQDEIFDHKINIRERDEAGNLTNEMKAFMDQGTESARAYCREILKIIKKDDVPIYCISNYYKDRFEFSKLILDMASLCPESR